MWKVHQNSPDGGQLWEASVRRRGEGRGAGGGRRGDLEIEVDEVSARECGVRACHGDDLRLRAEQKADTFHACAHHLERPEFLQLLEHAGQVAPTGERFLEIGLERLAYRYIITYNGILYRNIISEACFIPAFSFIPHIHTRYSLWIIVCRPH